MKEKNLRGSCKKHTRSTDQKAETAAKRVLFEQAMTTI
jgi:hypothetical protein